jgi:hypothetical protein
MNQNWICPHCRAYNHPRRQGCWQCGSLRAENTDSRKKHFLVIKSFRTGVLISIAIVCLLLSIVLIFLKPVAVYTTALVAPTKTLTPTATAIPTATPVPTVWPPKIAGLETLDSYRLQLKLSVEDKNVSQSVGLNVIQEGAKQLQAEHTILTIDGMSPSAIGTGIETISISNTSWLKSDGKWIRMTAPQLPYLSIAWESLEMYARSLKPAGEEVVNTVHCKHYTINEDISQTLGANMGDTTGHVLGDIWIADQPNLSPVVMRMQVHVNMKGILFPIPLLTPVPSSKTSTPREVSCYGQYDVTDINIPITIEPPK